MTGDFISCDWGTSVFRLRLVTGSARTIRTEFVSDEGVGRLAQKGPASSRAELFRCVLAKNLTVLARPRSGLPSNCPILISGMASSTIGWCELPYARLPFKLDGSDLISNQVDRIKLKSSLHPVVLLSGLASATDIMRGEETQVIGLAQHLPRQLLKQRALVLLPGTHSKHLLIQDGYVTDFATFMTGELFQLLSEQSVLRHSLQPEPVPHGPLRTAGTRKAFRDGARAGYAGPLVGHLFKVRTRQVLGGCGPESNRAFLSGLLIGAELAAIPTQADLSPSIRSKPTGSDRSELPVFLCAGEELTQCYQAARAAVRLPHRWRALSGKDTERLSVLGHAALLRRKELSAAEDAT